MALPIIDAVLGIGEKLIDKLIPDPQAKAAAILELQKLQQNGDLAIIANQVELDKIEAASTSKFISGWRPAVGWVCVAGLGYTVLLSPLIAGVCEVFGRHIAMPVVPMETIVTLLVGMLGFGGLRTVEKLQGVASK